MSNISKIQNWLKHDIKSERTYETYMITIEEFDDLYGLENLNAANISEYLMDVKEGLKDTSKARHLYALKKVEKPLLLYDIIEEEVRWDQIPGIEQSYGEEYRYLGMDELEKLLYHATKYRDRAMVLLGYDVALRVSEMAKIKHNEVDLEEGTIDLSRVKGGEKKIWELSDKTVDALSTFIEEGNTGREEVFDVTPQRLNQCFRALGREAGLIEKGEDFGLHVLRHTRATELAKSGWNMDSIREFLGQKSIQSTEKYVHTAPEHLTSMKRDKDKESRILSK